MNRLWSETILAGAIFALLGLAPEAFAQTPISPDFTSPQNFENPEVAEKCGLPGVEARVRLNSPNNPGDTMGENNGGFYEAVYEDRGDGLIFVDDLTLGRDQFLGVADGGGSDFIVQKVNTTFNLYCLVTAAEVLAQGIASGKTLRTNFVEVGWTFPLCRAQESNVTNLCLDFNPTLGGPDAPTDEDTNNILGNSMSSKDPLLACGCGNVVAIRCEDVASNGFNLSCLRPTAEFEGAPTVLENNEAGLGATVSVDVVTPLGASVSILNEVETEALTRKQTKKLCRVCSGGSCFIDQECMSYYGF